MTGLSIPDDYPLQDLVGQELTQVCIGKHSVGLKFYQYNGSSGAKPQWESGATVDIESGFELREGISESRVTSNETLGENAGCLTVLLGGHIASVRRLPKNELLLVFVSGAELQLRTDPVGFESYHLFVSGQSVDVTAEGRRDGYEREE